MPLQIMVIRVITLVNQGWGLAVLISTVWSSGVSTSTTRRTVLIAPLPIPVSLFMMRQNEKITSLPVKGSPFEKRALGFSLNSQVVSSTAVQDSARRSEEHTSE